MTVMMPFLCMGLSICLIISGIINRKIMRDLREANREIHRLKAGVKYWMGMAISHSEALRSYKRDRSLACSRAAKIGVAKRAKQKAEA